MNQKSIAEAITTSWVCPERGLCGSCKQIIEVLSGTLYDMHENDMVDVIKQRDHAEEWADKLADAIAPVEKIGEHSNVNNPWANALEIINREP